LLKADDLLKMGMIIGVDIGGTFTDGVLLLESGEIFYSKVPTTPSNRFEGIYNALTVLSIESKIPLEKMLRSTEKFAHGTTATVNAFIQRQGAKVGLLVTKGFKNTLDIMKAGRGKGLPEFERMNFGRVQMPEPLVPPWLVEEIEERVDYAGRIIVPLHKEDVRRALSKLASQGVEAVAVCFLWSFKNPKHEIEVLNIAREMGHTLPISISSELLPVQGEYERMITTVINCYLSPILAKYIYALQEGLSEKGLANPVLIMQSMGGLIPGVEAPKRAVTTLVSGLAGGLIGSQYLSGSLGYENVITTDMGGTSFEVGIIYEGLPLISNTPLAPSFGPYISRFQLSMPEIDITAIGSGAGSIAWIDGGLIKVGPLSAQAVPGPACYGHGGIEPTVTDACVVLGYLSPENFLGGKLRIDPSLSLAAIKERIAEPLGMDPIDAAKGIHAVVNNQMADLTRKVTIEKGYDPRNFVLFAYGGAGPMNCMFYGGELGVPKIIVPGRGLATAHSALGIGISDYKQVFAVTDIMMVPCPSGKVNAHYLNLEMKARKTLASWGVSSEDIVLVRTADMQYGKQVHELNIQVPPGELSDTDIVNLGDSFEKKYEAIFGLDTGFKEAGIELVNFRVEAIGKISKPQLVKCGEGPPDASNALRNRRRVFFSQNNEYLETKIYDGEKLLAGNQLSGPAIVEYFGTTAVIPPSFQLEVDPYGNLISWKE
jgi:N-methylhydantoinase A